MASVIDSFFQFLQRSTSQLLDLSGNSYDSVIEEPEWQQDFDEILLKSHERPRLLVDFIRRGIPDTMRGRAWCSILRINEVPSKR